MNKRACDSRGVKYVLARREGVTPTPRSPRAPRAPMTPPLTPRAPRAGAHGRTCAAQTPYHICHIPGPHLQDSETPLHKAAKQGHEEIGRILIKARASLDASTIVSTLCNPDNTILISQALNRLSRCLLITRSTGAGYNIVTASLSFGTCFNRCAARENATASRCSMWACGNGEIVDRSKGKLGRS